jgi:phage shock protein A
MPFDDEKKIKRLKEREAKLVSRGNKAVDEGREKKADRLLGRAARVENRIITLEEKGKIPMRNDAIDKLRNLDTDATKKARDEADKYLKR